jgi:broad specificity phosphatase PhoE
MIVREDSALRETRVLLLRHAETAAPDRFHGAESDIGLSVQGQRQAEQAAEQIATLRPAAIYCSAMRRAVETAEPIGRACGLVPQRIATLHERRMGRLSGQLREAARPFYETVKEAWEAGNLDSTHEGGESYAEMRRRVVPAWNELVGRSRGQTIVVVAHGVVIRVLLTSLLEGYGPHDFSRIGISHVAINDLRYDGLKWRADSLCQSTPERHADKSAR